MWRRQGVGARTRQGRRRPLGRLALVAATGATCAYFAHHATSGANGWDAREARIERVAALKAEIAGLVERRGAAEARNRLISGATIERDVLDERARALLGVVREDEIVVMLPPA